MAARKTAAQKVEESKKAYLRVEQDEAVAENLDEDDLWNDIVTRVKVPPFKIRGIIIPQPTKEQVDDWAKLTLTDPIAAERILLGDEAYDRVQELFKQLPNSAYAVFQDEFMNHMFRYKQG